MKNDCENSEINEYTHPRPLRADEVCFETFTDFEQILPRPLRERAGVRGKSSHRFYAPYMKEFARQMRKEPTIQENKLWQILRNSNTGYKFRRQFSINDKYIADFVCLEKRLIIEIDGGQHNESFKDVQRTFYLNGQNFRVIRFWNNEIDNNIEGCYEVIIEELKSPLTPTLSRKGRGSIAEGISEHSYVRSTHKGRGSIAEGISEHSYVRSTRKGRGSIAEGISEHSYVRSTHKERGSIAEGISEHSYVRSTRKGRGSIAEGISEHSYVRSTRKGKGSIKILITGSSGFIGKNLKKGLQEEYELLTPTHSELELTSDDAVKRYFQDNKIDFIIHCASIGGARGVTDEKMTIEKNLAMVRNLISYKRDDVRIILFGSGAMYDKSRDLHKVKESEIGEVIPKDLYGLSKLKISELTKLRNDITCLNIFACYGYDEKSSRFPSYAIDRVLNDKPIVINQNAIFDYLFVEDMVKIVKYFIKNVPCDKIINITPTESVSLAEIASLVNMLCENPVGYEIQNEVMNFEYTGDNELLLRNYKGLEFTSIKDGLKKLYDYMRKNK